MDRIRLTLTVGLVVWSFVLIRPSQFARAQCVPNAFRAKLDNPAPAMHDLFGSSVAVSNSVAVVGAANRDTGGGVSGAGAAYVFDADPASPTFGAILTTLDNPAPSGGDRFGSSVAVSGGVAVVGADEDGGPISPGTAYVFDADPASPTFGALLTTLDNPAPSAYDYFGYSVAVSGNVAVVGAYGDDPGGVFDAGTAYVFDADPASPTFGALLRTLDNPAPAAYDYFGYSVAVSGNIAVVGATEDDPGGVSAPGTAYVFDADPASPTFGALLATLDNPEPAAVGQFGRSVAVSGGVAVVGADRNEPFGGAAYFFDADPASPTFGGHLVTLGGASPGDTFGESVAISGGIAVVGAGWIDLGGVRHSGSVYVFDADAASPTFGVLLDTINHMDEATSDKWGHSVAVSGGVAVVGARQDDSGSVMNAGTAYAFVCGVLVPTSSPTPSPSPTSSPSPTPSPSPSPGKGERNDGPGGVGSRDGLSELNLWLAADQGVGGALPLVDSWQDLSGNGLGASQASPAAQPSLAAASINGRPAVVFDGVRELVTGDVQGDFASDQVSMFIVSRTDAGGIQSSLLYVANPAPDNRFNIHLPWSDGAIYWDFGEWLVSGRVGADFGGAFGTFHQHGFFSNVATGQRVTRSGALIGFDGDGSVAATAGFPVHLGANAQAAIAEVVIYNEDLEVAERIIVENYLAAKYDLALNTVGGAKDIYAGDESAAGEYDNDMIGIGRESDGAHHESAGAGLILGDFGFLQDSGDYAAAGHNEIPFNIILVSDIPPGIGSRWSRVWYLDITDAGGNGGQMNICFSAQASGLGALPAGEYSLMHRPGLTGEFSVVAGSGESDGNQVVAFSGLDVLSLPDGYYTLGLSFAPPPSPTPVPPTPSPSVPPTAAATATPSATSTAVPCCPGDANNSGSFVDANDFIAVQAHFGADNGVGGLGDANCSGSFVDANDFIAVQAAFGADCTP